MKKELIVYFAPRAGEARDVEALSAVIVAACADLQVRICREDDLSVAIGSPTVGIEVEGRPDQIATLEARLREAGCRVEDGGRQIHALDEEGGQKP